MRDGNDDVARLHSRGHQGKAHGIGAVGYTNAILCAAKRGEFVFEIFNHRAADKTRRIQSFLENGSEFRLELLVRRNQIQKRKFFDH